MRQPLTAEQFFAAAAFFLIFVSRSWASIAISLTLAFFWAWLALTYHLLFFARINLLAYAFSGLSFIGAFIFLWQGVIRHRLRFAWRADARSSIGVAPGRLRPSHLSRLVVVGWTPLSCPANLWPPLPHDDLYRGPSRIFGAAVSPQSLHRPRIMVCDGNASRLSSRRPARSFSYCRGGCRPGTVGAVTRAGWPS